MNKSDPKAYFKATVKLVLVLLSIWFFVSYGCGILWRDWLDEHMFRIGEARFGFWMAQQGSILSFVLLLVVYRYSMNRLDAYYGFEDVEEG